MKDRTMFSCSLNDAVQTRAINMTYLADIDQWRQNMKAVSNATDIDLDVIILNVQTASVYFNGSSSEFVFQNLEYILRKVRNGRTVNSMVGYSHRLINEHRQASEEAKRN